MNYVKYLPYLMMAITAALTGKISFPIAGYMISVFDKGGNPVHLTIAGAVAAAKAVASGVTGNITSGDITLQIVPPGATA